ncbi:unnamed protein product [Albugo candida]|uniref:Uncharacterized protein n=1 Tax=Albugo candida TaxID=65357 RepID=A0A024G461_9STRA|nr:unnamed protein product [Albugo candida]|eukprot:CCI41551.1 unnamed protein product [Albugo candida]
MCILRDLSLILLQLLIPTSNAEHKCFIRDVTTCTSNSDGPQYHFCLGEERRTLSCTHELLATLLSAELDNVEEYDLTPQGSGKDCARFRYDFYGEKLTFSVDGQPPGFSNDLVVDAVNDAVWKVESLRAYIDGVNMDGSVFLVFQIGIKTALLAPKATFVPEPKEDYMCAFTITGDKRILIKTPTIGNALGSDWVLVIGMDLLESSRISFIKLKKEKFQIQFGKLPVDDPIHVLQKKQKKISFLSIFGIGSSSGSKNRLEEFTISVE